MEQPERIRELERFKADEINILVASDVAARGLDIKGVSHVINYDVPWHPDDYVHRIGRTGRAGAKGIAITIATPDDAEALANIEKLIGLKIARAGSGVSVGTEPTAADDAPARQRRSSTPPAAKTPPPSEPATDRPRRERRTPQPAPVDTAEEFVSEVPAFLARPIRRPRASPAVETIQAPAVTAPALSLRADPPASHPFGEEGVPAFLLRAIHA